MSPAIYPVRPTKYVLDGSLADLGPTGTVRRLVPHDVSDADARRVAAALSLEAARVVRNADGYSVSGPEATLTISLTGSSSYVTYGLGGPQAVGGSSGAGTIGSPTASSPSTVPPDVPDEQATATIARALLDRMGVLGTEQWTVDVSNSGGVAVACSVGVPCPTVPPVVYERTATFSRVVDDTNVQGADWSVTVGAHGKIESVSGNWTAATTLGDYPLRSTRHVFADLQAGKARLVGPQPMTALGTPAISSPSSVVVHVTGVARGYATWDAFDGANVHTDLVPTYRFHARAADGGTPYDIEVLALDPSAFDIVSPPTSVPKVIPEPAPAPAP